MESLTMQAHIQAERGDITQITFSQSDEGNFSISEIHYQSEYAISNYEKDDHHAGSLNQPVSFLFDDNGQPSWLRFLDIIVPSGSNRRYWAKQLDIGDLTTEQQNFILLKFGTISPVGNLRVKERLPKRTSRNALSISAAERKYKTDKIIKPLFTGEINQGKALKALRISVLAIKQDTFAKMVGVSRKTISEIEYI